MLLQVKYAFIAAAVVLLFALVYTDLPGFPSASKENSATASASSTVQIKDTVVRVTVADTAEERGKGLSGWAGLAEDEGMLFVFEEDGRPSFWMKDMRFAIDILWISKEGVIVGMQEGVSPETYPTAFTPKAEARYVLELQAGYSQKHDITVGDPVELPVR
jgi:uncharacterized membrane protein (UPF0127 family)